MIVQSNMPELCLEVEYMMELLETPWLTGEGIVHLKLKNKRISKSFLQSVNIPSINDTHLLPTINLVLFCQVDTI